MALAGPHASEVEAEARRIEQLRSLCDDTAFLRCLTEAAESFSPPLRDGQPIARRR